MAQATATRRTRRNATALQTKPLPPGGFYALAALVAVLNIVGLAMVLSASSVHDLRVYHSAWYSFIRQLIYILVGAGVMAFTVKVDYRRWRRFAVPLFGISLVLLLMVLVPRSGMNITGSSRWVDVWPLY